LLYGTSGEHLNIECRHCILRLQLGFVIGVDAV